MERAVKRNKEANDGWFLQRRYLNCDDATHC